MPVPQAIASPPAADAGAVAVITPTFDEGSLLVTDAHGKFFRLLWPAKDGGKEDRRRALSPGKYRLTGYHLVRRDTQGKEWFIWVNLHAGRPLTAHAGDSLPVKTDDTITLTCKAKAAVGAVEIMAAVTGDHHAGLTIYKEGKRIPLHYRITGRDNQVLATGTLEYG